MTDQHQARWMKAVAGYAASELTQRESATERGVSFCNRRNPIYKLRKETWPLVTNGAKVSGQGPVRAPTTVVLRLVPVRTVASVPKARRPEAAAPAAEGLVELALPSEARLRPCAPPG